MRTFSVVESVESWSNRVDSTTPRKAVEKRSNRSKGITCYDLTDRSDHSTGKSQ